MYSVIDLFAGCGGLSRGLERTGWFGTDFAVELERHAAATASRNLRSTTGQVTDVYCGDINALLADRSTLSRSLAEFGHHEPGHLDLLAGGPPCQGFSRNGVRRYEESGKRFYDMPVNHLYRAFLGVLELTMPRVVLIENVREFLNAAGGKFRDDLFLKLTELGYTPQARVVCAADYGVPQVRNRMIVVAARDGVRVDWPAVTHHREGPFLMGDAYRTVRDAVSDLPDPDVVQSLDRVPYTVHGDGVSDFAQSLRSSAGGVTNHVARKLSTKNLERIRAVGVGRMRDVERSLQTKGFYGSAYGRLDWDQPSLTITTWVYHVGSGRFAHPAEDRAITMREAARLQSFDDDFVFSPLINPVSRMIGNAVPPLLGEVLGRQIAQGLDAADRQAVEPPQMATMSF